MFVITFVNTFYFMNQGLIIILILFGRCTFSQNLVANASFEDPVLKNFNSVSASWQTCLPGDTPDYFTDSVYKNVFSKYLGGAEPHSGHSFIGLFVYRKRYTKRTEIREFVQSPLKEPLIKDKYYYVEVYIHADKEANVTCDGFGICFCDSLLSPSKTEQMYLFHPAIGLKPQQFINNNNHWEKLSGNFRANGKEKYIILGNFKDDASTNKEPLEVKNSPFKKEKWNLRENEEAAYFYIDDIKVIYDDSLNNVKTDYLKSKESKLKPTTRSEIPTSIKPTYTTQTEKEFMTYLTLTKTKSIDTSNFRTATLKKGRVFNLKNILFENDKSDFRPVAVFELNELVKLLQDNSTVEIEVSGHTDDNGTTQHNIYLSLERAKAVENFLILNGINKKRIRSYGYGSAKPIDTNETEKGRTNNRRIEIMITKQ